MKLEAVKSITWYGDNERSIALTKKCKQSALNKRHRCLASSYQKTSQWNRAYNSVDSKIWGIGQWNKTKITHLDFQKVPSSTMNNHQVKIYKPKRKRENK